MRPPDPGAAGLTPSPSLGPRSTLEEEDHLCPWRTVTPAVLRTAPDSQDPLLPLPQDVGTEAQTTSICVFALPTPSVFPQL